MADGEPKGGLPDVSGPTDPVESVKTPSTIKRDLLTEDNEQEVTFEMSVTPKSAEPLPVEQEPDTRGLPESGLATQLQTRTSNSPVRGSHTEVSGGMKLENSGKP